MLDLIKINLGIVVALPSRGSPIREALDEASEMRDLIISKKTSQVLAVY
jgi:hypothetical protein